MKPAEQITPSKLMSPPLQVFRRDQMGLKLFVVPIREVTPYKPETSYNPLISQNFPHANHV